MANVPLKSIKFPGLDDTYTVPVQDVQVNGTSIVVDGVANVPVASGGELGVVKIHKFGYNGLMIQNDGEVKATTASDTSIKKWQRRLRTIECS